jgi:hypothetical protein
MAPVALVLTTHLLMQQASWRHQEPAMGGPQPGMRAAMAGHEPAMLVPMVEAAEQEPDPEAQARRIYEQHQATGTRLAGAALARHVGISDWHGRRLLAEFRADEADRRNGDGPPSTCRARDHHAQP